MSVKGRLAVLFILSCIFACSSIDCPVQNTVYARYNLYRADETVDTLKDTMYVFSRRADRKDTLLFNSGIGLTSFLLHISYSNPEDTLYFIFHNNDFLAIDTVWVKKIDIPHFESVDCSASFFHELTDVRCTHHAIDSVVIKSKMVDYDSSSEHFRLYLKSSH